MDYSILAIRSADEEDDRLFPRPTEDSASVVLDRSDGEALRVPANALRVRKLSTEGSTTLLSVTDVEVEVLVTDVRVAVACAKFDTREVRRGISDGRLAVERAANALSNGHPAHLPRRRMLVGHVRYAWLSAVGFKPKTGWRSSQQIRLCVVVRSAAGEYRKLCLDLALPNSIDSSAVARAIVKRAARYRLDFHCGEADIERAQFEMLAAGPALNPAAANRFAVYEMPRYFCVSAASAYPQRRGV